jgi:putative ABC transport system ATP-binding protein
MNESPKNTALQVNVTAFSYAGAPSMALPIFEARSGEIVVLSGRSGTGKSTLMHLATGVLGFDRTQGSIRIGDRELAGLSQYERDCLRPNVIGWVPQRVHLISALSVIENVMLPVTMARSNENIRASETSSRAKKLMQAVGIDAIANASAANVSVGQAARACVVRALIGNPVVLCADEPSAALDQSSADAIASVIAAFANDGGVVLIASHDAAFAAALAQHSRSVRTIALEPL